MFSILRPIIILFAGIITKLMSNKVTNTGISGKYTHTPMHQNLAALTDTSGYFIDFKLNTPSYYLD